MKFTIGHGGRIIVKDAGTIVGGPYATMDEAKAKHPITRKVTTPTRGPDGLCVEPDDFSADREKYEGHQRERAAHELDYADRYVGNPRTVDEDGDYVCGECNKAEDAKCLQVVQADGKTAIKVNLKAGSCRYWENLCAGDPEAWCLYSPIDLAAYAISAVGGWGCHRCPFGVPAKRPDSVGRTLYCKKIDARVFPTACCAINGARTVPIDANGNPTQA